MDDDDKVALSVQRSLGRIEGQVESLHKKVENQFHRDSEAHGKLDVQFDALHKKIDVNHGKFSNRITDLEKTGAYGKGWIAGISTIVSVVVTGTITFIIKKFGG